MQDEWIPFLEAIHRMHDRLFLADFRAKPLLRSAVASGRVCGRGEYKERGQIIFTRYGENLGDENVIHEGSLCYKVEVYPGEVVLAELRSWMDSLSDDSPLLRPFIVPPQQIDSSLAGGGHGGEAQEGASGSVTRDGQPESSAHAAEAATAESPPREKLTEEEAAALFRAIKKRWEENGKTNEYRVTRDGWHNLCNDYFEGRLVTTGVTRAVYDDWRPFEWDKTGRFSGQKSADELLAEMKKIEL